MSRVGSAHAITPPVLVEDEEQPSVLRHGLHRRGKPRQKRVFEVPSHAQELRLRVLDEPLEIDLKPVDFLLAVDHAIRSQLVGEPVTVVAFSAIVGYTFRRQIWFAPFRRGLWGKASN
jgi:hypothetical protein